MLCQSILQQQGQGHLLGTSTGAPLLLYPAGGAPSGPGQQLTGCLEAATKQGMKLIKAISDYRHRAMSLRRAQARA
jgi:hypothetical protein